MGSITNSATIYVTTVLAAAQGCDTIVHAGAIAHDTGGTAAEILATNLLGTWHVLLAAERSGIDRVVYFSSGQVFGCADGEGVPLYVPIDDDHPLRAARPYGMSKRLAEGMCAAWTSRTGLTSLVLRPVLILDDEELARTSESDVELGRRSSIWTTWLMLPSRALDVNVWGSDSADAVWSRPLRLDPDRTRPPRLVTKTAVGTEARNSPERGSPVEPAFLGTVGRTRLRGGMAPWVCACRYRPVQRVRHRGPNSLALSRLAGSTRSMRLITLGPRPRRSWRSPPQRR